MFWWSSKKRIKQLEEKTQESFSSAKKDIDATIAWVKHLNNQNKQLFDLVSVLRTDLSSLEDEIGALREGLSATVEVEKNKQVFKKLPVLDKQTGVLSVENAVQTAVQTDNFYEIFKGLTGNERLLVFTIMNNEMKLSYEDLALLLGKETSTVRGQINSIKQKCNGLIQEISEKNGKKRVFIEEGTKSKIQRYAKTRTLKKTSKKRESES